MSFTVRLADWQQEGHLLKPVRHQVFVLEQGVPPALEMDAADGKCVHAMATDLSGNVIGTGRLLPSENGIARIGRMAVYAAWRNLGVGKALLQRLSSAAHSRGDHAIELHAQLHAAPFYEAQGYSRVGDVYLEAGIEHVNMRKTL